MTPAEKLDGRHGRQCGYRLANCPDADEHEAWLASRIGGDLRKKLDFSYRVRCLARHYIDAAIADGAGWMNLKVQAEAPVAADASLVVETTGGPFTVADLLRALPVVEWHDGHYWRQTGPGNVCWRWWRSHQARWSWWSNSQGEKIGEHSNARLVPASEADADPATRGPIGGGE